MKRNEELAARRQQQSRRNFLTRSSLGFAGLALGAMLHRDGYGHEGNWAPPDGKPHFAPKAKSVIWLFMNGGTSHMESFDPKPMLTKYAGKTIAETPYADVLDPKKLTIERVMVKNDVGNRNTIYPLQVGFQKYGDNGVEISDWFPHIGRRVDKLSIIRSMITTDSCHGAQTEFYSGRNRSDGDFPTLGAWVHYGLGSLNDNLPQFISIGAREYWNRKDGHYLGPAHDAVPLRIDPANPLDYSRPERPFANEEQAVGAELIRELNSLRGLEYPEDPALSARINSYELAFRMQKSIPEVVDFSNETAETRALYGLDLPHCKDFAAQVLAARRFVERGVRFIQIQHGGLGAGAWDAHAALKAGHTKLSLEVDQPIAALIDDLERRGMLDETLVVFATEFGRSPGSQNSDGRDHHNFGFSIWMCGGGIKQGVVHGVTDELGFHAIENRHYVTDVHATVLKQLGLDSRKLEIPGRKRLEIDHGTPIFDIIA